MTKWLASVQSLEEAQLLSSVLPDILDMKNPSQGALGALPANVVGDIVHWVANRCETSATVGDLPMDSDIIMSAIQTMAETGVDYVKIGLFPCKDLNGLLNEMTAPLTALSTPVIAVIFADKMAFDPELLLTLHQAGFAGVMVDTATKNGQHLCQHWSLTQLHQFTSKAKALGLLTGLAGALRYQDIALLKEVNADYLGFRSALCQQQKRTNQLTENLACLVQQAIQTEDQTLKKAI